MLNIKTSPREFVTELRDIEVSLRKENDNISVSHSVALDLVNMAFAFIKTEVEMNKFNSGFGYKKEQDTWAMALEELNKRP